MSRLAFLFFGEVLGQMDPIFRSARSPTERNASNSGPPLAQKSACEPSIGGRNDFERLLATLVSETEQAMSEADPTRSLAVLSRLRRDLDRYEAPKGTYEASLIAMQTDVIGHYQDRHALMHEADLPPAELSARTALDLSSREIYAWHESCHLRACTQALSHYKKSAAKRDEERAAQTPVADRRQRYAISFGRDEAFVDTDGLVGGAYQAKTFVGLSVVEPFAGWQDKLFLLQGEGPHTGPAATSYVQASIRYARRVGSERVLFVNVATEQVDFAADLAKQAELQQIRCDCLALPWLDGARTTPFAVAEHARTVATSVRMFPKPTTVVFNCYGGLDRSGLTLALTQLVLANEQKLFSSASCWSTWASEQLKKSIQNMKAARPRAITTPARALLLFEAAQTLCL